MLLVFPRSGIRVKDPGDPVASSERDKDNALGTPSSSLRVYCLEILKNKKSGTPNERCLILENKINTVRYNKSHRNNNRNISTVSFGKFNGSEC